jgi:hypothetical protein
MSVCIPPFPPNCRVDAVVPAESRAPGSADTTSARPSGTARYGSVELRTTVTPLLTSSSDDAPSVLVTEPMRDAIEFELDPL